MIEPEELNPLPATRPADPNKAVEYDVIKAVWAKKKVRLSVTVIRFALGEYWDIFKGIRDKWKTKAASLQQAVERKDHGNAKAYERRVLDQRRLLDSCIGITLKHGHPDIIEKYVYFISSPSVELSALYPTVAGKCGGAGNIQVKTHESVKCHNGRDLVFLSQAVVLPFHQAILAFCEALDKLVYRITLQRMLGVSKALEMSCAIIA